MPEYIVFVPYEGSDMVLGPEEQTAAQLRTLAEVSADECFLIRADDLTRPQPISESEFERFRGAE